MLSLKPSKIPALFRLFDYIMIPLMFVLGGFKRDSLQETHPWHCYREFNVESIDIAKTLKVQGEERAFKKHFLFLFHAPIFGGWKRYCVLAPTNTGTPFHIGWIVKNIYDDIIDYGINKKPISDPAVRMLTGPTSHQTLFFAVDDTGNQLNLTKIGEGVLGDGKHPEFRLL